MLMGDFSRSCSSNLPVKVIVYNNASLGFVAMEMKAGGYLDTDTDLKNPNFAAMAEAMGISRPACRGRKRPRSRVRPRLRLDGPASSMS